MALRLMILVSVGTPRNYKVSRKNCEKENVMRNKESSHRVNPPTRSEALSILRRDVYLEPNTKVDKSKVYLLISRSTSSFRCPKISTNHPLVTCQKKILKPKRESLLQRLWKFHMAFQSQIQEQRSHKDHKKLVEKTLSCRRKRNLI